MMRLMCGSLCNLRMISNNPTTLSSCSPLKSGQKSLKKGEEKKAEPCSPDANSSSLPKPTAKGGEQTSHPTD